MIQVLLIKMSFTYGVVDNLKLSREMNMSVFMFLFQIRENEAHLESKEVKIRELKSLYETSKENEAKLTTMLESYRQQILELESKAGSYETVVGRSEFTVSELQRQIRDGNDKILELESRIR